MNARIGRPQVVRGAFHITARTQGRSHWFVPSMRSHIANIITAEMKCTDAKLLAFAVMPNHIHIVLIQGVLTLGRVMQPVLRRIALLTQRTHQTQGHVFERRYSSAFLDTPDYLREAIVYTTLNPFRAGLCNALDEYEWTSHAALAGRECAWAQYINVADALAIFAETAECGLKGQRASYERWIARRLATGLSRVDVQLCSEGNRTFVSRFATTSTPGFAGPDLRDAASKALHFVTDGCELEQLKGSYLTHDLAAVRKQVMAFLLLAGYPTGKISSYFAVAPSTVSKVAYQLKTGRRTLN